MEINRREALMGALLPFIQAASQQARPQNTVFEHDLPNVTLDGWQVNVSTITLPPGSVGNAHRHPGFVLVYVLEGEVITKISDQQQATYSAGQMFYEQPGSTHEVSRNASSTKPAKFLAMIFSKKGLPLVTPA
jgi:quercetin dioxygenase-like cupin family protein